jgi:sugar lactone lactonase YvrE
MRQGRLLFIALCGVSLALVGGSPGKAAAPPAPAGCEPDGQLRYVCGPVNAEDLIRLGNTRWLITSGMDGPLTGGAEARGHLYLVDHEAKSFSDWFPAQAAPAKPDTTLFRDCPGPVDSTRFSAHGLALKEQSAGRFRLYVTAHGAREAIEVFDVDATGARPTIAWAGCVVLPEKVSANSVAILPDGGFVTTKFMDRSQPLAQAFGAIRRGEINGELYEWHPGGKVQAIAGTEMSGPNGILASPDGRTLYVASYGTNELVKFERNGATVRKQVVKMEITPDNLRWSGDGKFLAAGGNHAPAACATPPCPAGWAVFEVDAQTLAARRVAGADRATGMQGATAAVRVGSAIWVGTFSGNRIGYLPASP